MTLQMCGVLWLSKHRAYVPYKILPNDLPPLSFNGFASRAAAFQVNCCRRSSAPFPSSQVDGLVKDETNGQRANAIGSQRSLEVALHRSQAGQQITVK